MRTTASAPSLLIMNAHWGGLSFMWNALHPVVLPAMLALLVPAARKNTYLGLLTFAGLVIAMLIQPLMGAISDGWASRYGRRRPLMVIGTTFSIVFLAILGWAGGLAWIFVGYVGLQVSSNTAQGPLQGLLRDRVVPEQLGRASAVKVFLDLASLVVAALIAGRLMAAGRSGHVPVLIVVMGVLLGTAAVTILGTREAASVKASLEAEVAVPGPPPRVHRVHSDYWWLIAERGVFLLGAYGLQAFGQYYLQDALSISNPVVAAGNLLSVIGAGTIAFVVLGGWLADRLGARRVLLAASLLAAGGLLLLISVSDLRGLYAAGGLVGSGMGLFLTSNWALANRLAPPEQAGRHLGLTNVATAGAAALARLEGPAVDHLNAAVPGEWLGYRAIFVFGAGCILVSTWFLTKVKSR